jgi:20S proteasome subunit beta 6
MQLSQPTERRWSPYEMNGGSSVAIAQTGKNGDGFVIVGSDTRLSRGYGILTRQQTKCVQLTSKVVLTSCGMHGDRNQLHTILKLRLQEYEQEHGKEMELQSIAQMLSNTLYYRRFFPYYTFNLLCGVNGQGEGMCYGYDAIGSFEGKLSGQVGSGMTMISPMLDYMSKRQHDQDFKDKTTMSLDEAKNIIKSAMNSVTERDIETGDYLELFVITSEGTKKELLPLRKD